jgi:hypothetical protein
MRPCGNMILLTNEWTWVKGPAGSSSGSYGVQGVPALSNQPPGRGQGTATWVDLQGNLWMFGGASFIGIMCDLWKYEISSNTWTWMKGPNIGGQPGVYGTQGVPNIANNPAYRYESSTTWTDDLGNLWLFGGIIGGAGGYNDLWRYNIATNTWTWMKGSNTINQPGTYGTLGMEAPQNTPGCRITNCHWVDKDGCFWLFSGERVYNPIESYNDIWRYNPNTNNWAWMGGDSIGYGAADYGSQCITTSSSIPGARFENRTVWTDELGNFWLFGGGVGASVGAIYNDLWVYCHHTNEWTWVSGNNYGNPSGNWGTINVPSPSNIPNGRVGAVGWLDNSGYIYVFGGGGNGFGGARNDLWRYAIDYACVPSCIATSSAEAQHEFKFELYPNPTASFMTVESGYPINQITISTTEGRPIKTFSNIHSSLFNVDMSNLTAGIYFLHCETEKGREMVKVVKY